MHCPDFVIIMAGGSGENFWPLSNQYPKQFLDITGSGQSMLQQTFYRFCKIVPANNIYVSTSKHYTGIVEEQLPALMADHIIAEPCNKNTAPGILYLCFRLYRDYPAAILLVTPADHQIPDETAFTAVCRKAAGFIQRHNALLTLGVKPTHPSTFYGYIQKHPEQIETDVYPVKQYIEKPYQELAKSLIRNDDFLWNSGIFIWKIKDIMNASQHYMPALFDLFHDIYEFIGTIDEHEYIAELYDQCQNISIDYGIMEKAKNVFIIPLAFEWCDLDTWGNAWENMQKDYRLNAIAGKDVIFIDSSGCVVHALPGKTVLVEGLEDYIVADSKDGLLICRKEKEREVNRHFTALKKLHQK